MTLSRAQSSLTTVLCGGQGVLTLQIVPRGALRRSPSVKVADRCWIKPDYLPGATLLWSRPPFFQKEEV